jgi:hypothetical protein
MNKAELLRYLSCIPDDAVVRVASENGSLSRDIHVVEFKRSNDDIDAMRICVLRALDD